MTTVLSAEILGYYSEPRGHYRPGAIDPPDCGDIEGLGGEVVVRLDRSDLSEMRSAYPRDKKWYLSGMLLDYCEGDLDGERRGDGFVVTGWEVGSITREGRTLLVTFHPSDAQA